MITEYTDRNEWLAEVERRGLVTVAEPSGHEGMHESDPYTTECAYPSEVEADEDSEYGPFGAGSWYQKEDGTDAWHGVLAEDDHEYFAWINEPPTEAELKEMALELFPESRAEAFALRQERKPLNDPSDRAGIPEEFDHLVPERKRMSDTDRRDFISIVKIYARRRMDLSSGEVVQHVAEFMHLFPSKDEWGNLTCVAERVQEAAEGNG